MKFGIKIEMWGIWMQVILEIVGIKDILQKISVSRYIPPNVCNVLNVHARAYKVKL